MVLGNLVELAGVPTMILREVGPSRLQGLLCLYFLSMIVLKLKVILLQTHA